MTLNITIIILLHLSPGGGGGDAAVHGAVAGGAVVLAAHQLARTVAVPVTVALRVTYCGLQLQTKVRKDYTRIL